MGTKTMHGRAGAPWVRSTSKWLLMLLALAVGVALFAQLPAQAVHFRGFELEGDAVNNDGDPDTIDWADIYADIQNDTGLYTSVFVSEPPETDITYFKGGGSKDINDVTEWLYDDTPSAPDKDEILNAYAYADFADNGDFLLYFGADRFSNDGDAAVGFWFFQDPVGLTNIASGGGFEFSGAHAEGDVFIVSNFTNGGAVDTVSVYQWIGGSLQLSLVADPNPGTACGITPADDDVCASVSRADDPDTPGDETDDPFAPWPYTPKANVGPPGLFPPAAFFEGGVNLSAILPGGFGCFSSFLAETRSSQETTAQLKDFELGQFRICDASIQIEPDATNEIGLVHTFTVTANRVVAGTETPAPDGTEVTVEFTSDEGQVIAPQACFTVAGTCDVSITSAVPDVISAHASATITVLGDDTVFVETDGIEDNSDDAVKTYVDARISIDDDAANEVGQPHTFTVLVEKNPGDGWVPAPNEIVTVDLTDADGASSLVSADTCATGTDVDGECTVTFSSDLPGTTAAYASVSIDMGETDGTTVDRETDGLAGNSDGAVKTWVDAYIEIEADATNRVGDPHVFTVTVWENDGSGAGFVAAAGETVSWSVTGSVGAVSGGTCTTGTTDGAGQCTLEVDSAATGFVEVTALSAVDVLGVKVDVETDGSTRPSGETNSEPATKTWVDANITIEADATNRVGDEHTFTVTVMVDDGSGGGFVAVADGQQVDVTYTESNGADPQADDFCLTVDGACTVTINSAATGQIDAHASTEITIDGLVFTIETDGTGGNSDDAVKTYVDAYIAIEPDATNRVGVDHLFTVNVMVDAGDGAGFVDVADGQQVDVTFTESNGATAQPADSCVTVAGECTVTVNSATTGQIDAHASADVVVDGLAFTIETDGVGNNSDDAVKTYVDARISISPDDVNRVGDPHTFTVWVEADLGDGLGWVDVAGQLVDVTYDSTADAQPDDSCVTDVDGMCDVIVNSLSTGLIEATASASVDVGIVIDVETDGIGENSEPATKTYVNAAITIEPDATNRAGDDHDFTVTVAVDEGAGLVPVADGQLVEVTYTESNGATAQPADSCETVAGACTVTINSPTTGQIDAHASTEITIDGLVFTIETDGAAGNSDDAVKTYVDAKIAIEPDATNRAGDDHEFTVTVMVDDGSGGGFTAVADDQVVDVTFTESNGATAQPADSCMTVAGECTVTINSPTTGQIDAHASTEITIDGLVFTIETDGVGDNSDDAVKTYVDARISIEEDGTNRTGDPHTFAVLVEEDNGDGLGWQPVDGQTVDVTYVSTADPQLDDQCVTDPTGVCEVTVNSATTGTIVATASAAVEVGPLGDEITIDVETDGSGENSGPATKTYVGAAITIEPDATNRAGDDHEFTATVTVDDGSGPAPVADGQLVEVTYTESNGATAQPADSCVTVAGECTVTVNSATTGQIDAHASAEITIDGLVFTVETDGVGDNSDDAVKTYVDAYIAIEPDGVNEVGVPHDFTATVWEDNGDGLGFVAAAGETVTMTFTESGGADAQVPPSDSCVTDLAGQCSLQVSSDNIGLIAAHASATVEVGPLGGEIDIDVETDGVAPNSGDAEKRYVDAAITIEADGVNEVGNEHTFTVVVTPNAGDTTVTDVTILVASDPAAPVYSSTCDTPTLELDGTYTCEVTINSMVADQYAVHATADVTFEDADANSAVVHRETDGSTTPSGLENSDDAIKRYVDVYITIVEDGVNGITEEHQFIVSVFADDGLTAAEGGDGVDGWAPAPNAPVSLLVLSNTTTSGAITGGSCVTEGMTGIAGTCSVIVESGDAGSIVVEASTEVAFAGLTDPVERTTDGVAPNSDPVTKTWVAGMLTWHKVDDLGAPLAGATFEVCHTALRPGLGGTAIEPPVCESVADNYGQAGYVGLDEDPAAGDFKLSGLILGTYTVRETAAPAGYTGDFVLTQQAVLTLDVPNQDIAEAFINYPPQEGCTPGFWQGGNGKWLWNDPAVFDGGTGDPDFNPTLANPYSHTTLFNSFFTAVPALDDLKMLDLVGTGGGNTDLRKAARNLVAAYLNASHDGVNFPYTTADLVTMWDAAVASGDFKSVHTTLGAANQLGCDL